MKKYEIMYIVNASLEDAARKEVMDGLHKIITCLLYTSNPALLKNITKHLYVKVAIYYDTSVYSVEKGIRNAIEVAWARGDISAIHSVFGLSLIHI